MSGVTISPAVIENKRNTLSHEMFLVKRGRIVDSEKSKGGFSEGVPPLPIPNREVKPLSADGTAKVGE
jgi:hypothetical protein